MTYVNSLSQNAIKLSPQSQDQLGNKSESDLNRFGLYKKYYEQEVNRFIAEYEQYITEIKKAGYLTPAFLNKKDKTSQDISILKSIRGTLEAWMERTNKLNTSWINAQVARNFMKEENSKNEFYPIGNFGWCKIGGMSKQLKADIENIPVNANKIYKALEELELKSSLLGDYIYFIIKDKTTSAL